MTPTIVTVPNYVRPTYAYSQPYTAPGSIQPQQQAVGQPLAMPNTGHTGPVVTSAALPPQTIQMPAGTTIQYNTMPVSIKPSSTTQQRYIPTTTTTPATTTTPITTTTAITTTPTSTTPSPFFARMGITYESWLEMNAIGSKWNKDPNQGYSFIKRVGRKNFEKMISIQWTMNAHSRKIDSGEIQGVKPGPCGLELKAHWSCRDNRKPATTTTITPATTTTPTTTLVTTPATTMQVMITKKDVGVTDIMANFLKKTVAVAVASAEEGTTKTQLARSIYNAIQKTWGRNGEWTVIVASTPEFGEGNDVWGSSVTPVQRKYLKLQLGDKLYCEIWKVRGNYRNF
mgnify:CR=1 FL=1